MKIKICPTCEKNFQKRQNQYCSRLCWKNSTHKKVTVQCKNCKANFLIYPSRAKKPNTLYCSKDCKYSSSAFKLKMSKSRTGKRSGSNHPCYGKKLSLEWRKNISEGHKGEKSSLWRGGLTSINMAIRQSFDYKEWRKQVFERDNYTCVSCGSKGLLNADHIKPFSRFPELRFDIDNGRTLCVDCHKNTDTFGRRALNFAV